MKNKLLLTISAFILVLLMINLVSSELAFFQIKQDLGNGTIRNYLYGNYDKVLSQVSNDYVKGNNPYEIDLNYRAYLKSWNIANPNNSVSYCNFQISLNGQLDNVTRVIYQENFSANNPDINNKDYFLRLSGDDFFSAEQKCYFTNQSYSYLYMPVEMQLYTPSWECKACQYYKWSLLQKDVIKADSLNSKVTRVFGYIKEIVLLNFEILLSLFWIFLIMMIFVSISFIFLGVYYLYLYIKEMSK